MRVLILGSGGREHALAWAIAASPACDALFAAPGNPGIAAHARCVPVSPNDSAGVIDFCRREAIDLVVVGPEAPLAAGIVDALAEAGIKAFGPTRAAAQLEASKHFTKTLCQEAGIATARFATFHDASAAKAYAGDHPLPVVIKADGLAAGKGVIIAATRAEAAAAIDAMLGGSFGEAGASIVIEEFLEGEEASFFALCDGETAVPLATAQDHKRAHDGDTGPNTGGMGAYSPAPVMTQALVDETMARIIAPTLSAMATRGTPFRGILYAGLMITDEGPKLIEYNCRFGDPEAQVLLVRLQSDLLAAIVAAVEGRLSETVLQWSPKAALTVVYAANGYPAAPEKGSVIEGVEAAGSLEDVIVFHAGTARDPEGRLIAEGGRVLNVTALGDTIDSAQRRAYQAVGAIHWPGGFYRRDIGWRAIARGL
ncbi:MAG: phosphoribosylamine--glycine ligase [Alphaproteobacteria bacterium]|nr:phosphoribosylamine--glycine ligase [Alphaproteobacteria bacterium]